MILLLIFRLFDFCDTVFALILSQQTEQPNAFYVILAANLWRLRVRYLLSRLSRRRSRVY